MLAERKARNVRSAPARHILRYSGLLYCEDCGRSMMGKRVKLKRETRVEYKCSTAHRYGIEHCSTHVVHEEMLDELIMAELKNIKCLYQQNWSMLEQFIDRWIPKSEVAGVQIKKLSEHILVLEDEVEVILMERIRDKANTERYDRMIQKARGGHRRGKKQIEELQNLSAVMRERQARLKRDIGMIDDILTEGRMSEAHLRMLKAFQ